MAKIQLKSDNINPFGGLFSILNQFDRSGLRPVIDRHLGQRGMTNAAFTHGDLQIVSATLAADVRADNGAPVESGPKGKSSRKASCDSDGLQFIQNTDTSYTIRANA